MASWRKYIPLIVKILISGISIVVLTYISFFLLIFFSFSNKWDYTVVFTVSYLFLLILIPVTIFKLFKKKIIRNIWFTFLALFLLTNSFLWIRDSYHNSIPKITDSDVNLSLYEPFGENTKAASLDTISTLKLEADLPRLDGATALYPLYAAFARAVYPQNDYDYYYSNFVRCTNTVNAYSSLIHAESEKKGPDIIFVAQPSEKQKEEAEEAGVKLKLTPIGKEAFVFFVNAKNPIDNLTVEQIRRIYSGEITNWKEVGGKNKSIRAFQRNENSGSQTAFLHFIDGHPLMTPPEEDIVHGMGRIIRQASDYINYSNSIGFSFRFYANEMVNNNEIKLLKINGIYPDIHSIQNGSYPMASYFYAVTLEGNDNPNVQLLIDWILSEQGQFLVEKTGYNSLKP